MKNDCRAKLDAYSTPLYGLTRDELRYTPYGVDPKEVHGEDFPGETFRVLKEKEIKQFGDAKRRTRCPGLEAWDRLDSSIVVELELELCRYRIILLYNTNTAANEPRKTGDRNANQNRTG